MGNGFIRKPSGLEAFFIDLDAGGCNMTFHFYLELDRKPNVERLREAMRRMVSTRKGINMRLYRNAWYVSSYEHTCPIVEVEDKDLDSYKPCRLNYHRNTIDLKVIHATLSDTWYLCFDFFHGIMDGRSGIQFVYDFFDILNDRRVSDPTFDLSACELVHHDKPCRKCRNSC